MGDKAEIISIIKRTEAEAERIRQSKTSKMIMNVCVLGAQAVRVLISIDNRLSNIEARLEGSEFAINRYIKSFAMIRLVATETINSDAEIT